MAVGGMTCAGCASTIQRGLALLPGVGGAAVNIVTRRATVNVDGEMDPAELEDMMRAAITGLGYQVPTPAKGSTPEAGAESMSLEDEHAAHTRADAARIADFRRRFIVGAALALPTMLISMIPAWQFAGWEWVVAALATPVVFYSGWPFHRSTLIAARHRATTMDTFVTVGSVTAWTWSTVALLRGTGDVYFVTAAVIVSLIVLGKWFEVRSAAHAGDAIRALSAR